MSPRLTTVKMISDTSRKAGIGLVAWVLNTSQHALTPGPIQSSGTRIYILYY